jgi:hypothetical protein
MDELLDRIVAVKARIKDLEGKYQELLDALTAAYERGEIDPSFTHDDWSISYNEGRRTWGYPPAVKALETHLKAARKLAEADGSAEARTGAPFWTVRPPQS